jgi:hypothetical protein
MASGILYVIFNKWINNPETNETPYKIGITKKSVDERYYGLGLKMPGKFEVLFAYRIENYEKVEKIIQDVLYLSCVNGEWFIIDEKKLNWIKETCENMGGIDITDEQKNEIETEINQEDMENNQSTQLTDVEHTGQLIIKRLKNYEFIKVNHINRRYTGINFYTEKMNNVLPPNKLEKGGTWNNGTKYIYWFDIRDDSTIFCLELGPNGQDESTIKKLNQITSIYNKDKVSSTDSYRRIYKKSLNIGLNINNNEEQINKEIDSFIIELLQEEEKIIKEIK